MTLFWPNPGCNTRLKSSKDIIWQKCLISKEFFTFQKKTPFDHQITIYRIEVVREVKFGFLIQIVIADDLYHHCVVPNLSRGRYSKEIDLRHTDYPFGNRNTNILVSHFGPAIWGSSHLGPRCPNSCVTLFRPVPFLSQFRACPTSVPNILIR